MSSTHAKLRQLRERHLGTATTLAEPLAMRFLKEVIEELQAEVDRQAETRRQQKKAHSLKVYKAAKAGSPPSSR